MATDDLGVPTDTGFRWDGFNSDLARQYYRRFKAGDVLAQRTYSNLPDAITSRLKDVGTTFDKVPGLLQRALVWDSGYVENGKYPNELVRVQTLEGISMAEIAISLERYKNVAGCVAHTCTGSGSSTWYKNDKCSGTDMLKAAYCMVDSFESGEDPHLAMWSTGGADTAIPAMRLLKHKWNVSTTYYEVAAIHTAEEDVEPKYDQCVIDSTDKSLQGTGSLVIACESPVSVSISVKASMKPPKPGNVVTAWLQQYAPTTSPPSTPINSTPISTPLANPAATPTSSPTPASAQSGTSIAVIVGVGAGVVAVLIAVGLLILCCRRRAQARAEADDASSQPQDNYQRPLPSPFLSNAMSLGTSSANKAVFNNVGSGTRSTGSSASRPSTYSLDETMKEAYQAVLETLVVDPRLAEKQIPCEQLDFANQVSNGAYGEVWVGYWNREIVAIKRLLRTKYQTRRDVETFAQEIQLSARLHHPNVVRFIGVSWNRPEDLCLVMEFLPAGDLSKVLRESGDHLTWNQHKLSMTRGLASALAYLHSQSPAIIHRDLKSKNVLLTNTLEPKIIDFGVSRRKMDDTMTAGVGTPFWTAPEVLEGLRYTEKSDIYSLGVLLTELDTCQIPYYDVPNDSGGMVHLKILNEVVSGKLRPSVTESCPEMIRKVVVSCLRQDPSARPTAAEVLWMLA